MRSEGGSKGGVERRSKGGVERKRRVYKNRIFENK